MTYLPDVNVWVALASNRHVHHAAAAQWLMNVTRDEVAFCRVTELGFLRLLTNAHVMSTDVLTPTKAWGVYEAFRADPRVLFLPEPAGFGEKWRQSGLQIQGGPNAWTDAYLAILAAYACATVVTLDNGFKPLDGCQVLYLPGHP